MRDNFAVQYGKGEAERDNSQPRWIYFQQLLFLKDVVTPRGLFKSSRRKETESSQRVALPPNEDEYESSTEQTDLAAVKQETSSVHEAEDQRTQGLENSDRDHPEEDDEAETSERPIRTTGLGREGFSTKTASLGETPTRLHPREKRKRKFGGQDANSSYSGDLDQLAPQPKSQRHCYSERQAMEMTESGDMDLMFLRTLLPHIRLIPQHKKLRFQSKLLALVERFAYRTGGTADVVACSSSSPRKSQAPGGRARSSYHSHSSDSSASPPPTRESDQQQKHW